jgi:hypothetical protein
VAKFNTQSPSTPVRTGPATSRTPDAVTHEGGTGYSYTPKTELFMLAVSNMVSEKTFYEKAEDRDARFEQLVRQVAVDDGEWFFKFLMWLRNGANMRSASVVAAAEAVHARLAANLDGNRKFIPVALARADEPGELLAYWESKYGVELSGGQRKARLPMPVKRGLSDAVSALYSEYSALKYDTAGKGKRFGDVIELTHASGHTAKQHELYRWLIDRRHGRDNGEYPSLEMLATRQALEGVPQEFRRSLLSSGIKPAKVGAFADDIQAEFKAAGVTWEWLASWVGGELDASFWEAVIPSMGYMALLRNLRNFDKAGISKAAVTRVQQFLSDPNKVAKSRQFPFRFWSAYQAVESERWRQTLEEGLDYSVQNIPELDGQTLVLVDTSGSMQNPVSEKSQMTYAQAAAIFGSALAVRNPGRVQLMGFADGVFDHPVKRGASIMNTVQAFTRRIGDVGHGTNIGGALQTAYDKHDRVILLSDMQTMDNGRFVEFSNWGGYNWSRSRVAASVPADSQVPTTVPVYAFNLAGYATAAIPTSGRRYNLGGGYTDAAFRLIPLLEQGRAGAWPWEVA